jgi:hypothetical protein
VAALVAAEPPNGDIVTEIATTPQLIWHQEFMPAPPPQNPPDHVRPRLVITGDAEVLHRLAAEGGLQLASIIPPPIYAGLGFVDAQFLSRAIDDRYYTLEMTTPPSRIEITLTAVPDTPSARQAAEGTVEALATALQRGVAEPDGDRRAAVLHAALSEVALSLGVSPAPAPPLPRAPDIPHVFLQGEAHIPSSLAVQGALASYRAGAEHWQPNPDGLPTFLYHQPQGRMVVFFRPPSDAGLSPALAESLWSQVQHLSDLDGDVLLATMAQALDGQTQAEDGSVWITADRILDYRGIRPKTKREGRQVYRAGHRREDLAEVAACFDRFASTWVELQEVEYRTVAKKGGKIDTGRLTLESPLIIVDERAVQHDFGAARLPVAWRYRLGRCVREYLDGPNRQVARLLQQSLQYDPYHERWEKRLALYCTFHLRMDQKQRGPLRREIGKLLQELNLPVDERHPERSRKRFATAMDRLVRDGCIGGWNYADPDASDRLPSRGWLPTWLALMVDIQRPAPTISVAARA